MEREKDERSVKRNGLMESERNEDAEDLEREQEQEKKSPIPLVR